MGTAHDAFSFPVSRYNILSFKKITFNLICKDL